MQRRTQREHGLSHRLWWLAAGMAVAVGLGIVLETPQTGDVAAAKAAPAHAAYDTQAGHDTQLGDSAAHKAATTHAAHGAPTARGG